METRAFQVVMEEPYEAAVKKVMAALKMEGFGIITQIDVRATIKEKLDEDFRPYIILGACNPRLAHSALELDPGIGVMLPCNVTVEERPDGGSLVSIANPSAMMGADDPQANRKLKKVAAEARERLERVQRSLGG